MPPIPSLLPTTAYPQAFRLPEHSGFGNRATTGLVRTKFDTGHVRQRRRDNLAHQTFNMVVILPVGAELRVWQKWIMAHGYDWFVMPVQTPMAGMTNRQCKPTPVRVISDLHMSPAGNGHMAVSFKAEIQFDINNRVIVNTGGWVIAKTPPGPSVDWVIARTPPNPAPLWVLAGTPPAPSVLV